MVVTQTPSVALVGNPNTGKTTLFNALAGMSQRVGNYPGVTVETKKGRLKHGDLAIDVIDLPGTYSLAPRSPDEMVAVDVILGHDSAEPRPDAVITILDASNLERNLYLMTQVLELGRPVVVALNMIDVAEAQGIKIDVAKLSQRLGVPIVPLQANKGIGLEPLKSAVAEAIRDHQPVSGPTFPDAFESEVAGLRGFLDSPEPDYLLRRLLLDVGGQTEKNLVKKHGPTLLAEVSAARQRLVASGQVLAGIEARVRYAWIRQAIAGCIERPAVRPVSLSDRLDKFLTHRVWGTLFFLTVMFLLFEAIFQIADPAKWVLDLGREQIVEWLSKMDQGPLRSLLIDGVVKGVGAVVVFLPQIMLLFAIIAFLEDCGYMARAAFLMDRLMARAGLNGKSFIPLLSSLACAVPGIMSARVIENPRDRLATILVAPLMSCSARLPVYSLLIGALLPAEVFGWWMRGFVLFCLYMLGLILAPLIALALKRTLLSGETPVFVMEMPPYKMPTLGAIWRRSWESGWMFLRRAGTFIFATMIVVWAALYFPTRDFEQRIDEVQKQMEGKEDDEKKVDEEKINAIQAEWKQQSILGQAGKWIEPAVMPLGWDWRIGVAAIASFPAREVMVGTLGIVFAKGEGDIGEDDYRDDMNSAIREANWEGHPDRKLFTVPVALSVMIFFALCCQCVSTLAAIRRETNSWRWPIFTFVYMTVLAYVGALLTYQIGSMF